MEALREAQAVIEFDPNGVILFANEPFMATVGYKLEEIQGKHHAMFVDPSERESDAYKSFWRKLGEGQVFQDQVPRVAAGGRRIWLQAIYTPIRNRSGAVTKVVKFATDITEQKNAEAELQGQMAAISKSQAVIEFDLTGNILRANENFLDATGYAHDEIVGQHHSMFVDEATKTSAEYREFWEKLGSGDFHQGRYRRIGKGGREIWIQASYNPIFDAFGKAWKIVKYATDITAARKAEIDLETAASEIAEVVEAAKKRDLTKLVPTENRTGNVLSLCNGVNELVSSYAEVVSSFAATTADVNDTAQEMTAASHNLSKRTEDQAASLEETAATSEQLAASVKATSEASRKAAAIAAEAMRSAETGGEIVGQAVDAMSKIEASSARISDITRVLDDIAFQTNLLALNAAVEAARAGPAGKGFAVVASEVRTLAQRSGAAAKDIFTLISSSHGEVGQGVKLVREAGDALTAILASSRKVAGTIADISSATGEQAHGIDEVSQTVADLDSITQANAALAEESAASAKMLSERAQRLHDVISSFRMSGEHQGRHAAALPGMPNDSSIDTAVSNLRSLAATAYAESKPRAGGKSPTWPQAAVGAWEEF